MQFLMNCVFYFEPPKAACILVCMKLPQELTQNNWDNGQPQQIPPWYARSIPSKQTIANSIQKLLATQNSAADADVATTIISLVGSIHRTY